jgi:hypothetical protein
MVRASVQPSPPVRGPLRSPASGNAVLPLLVPYSYDVLTMHRVMLELDSAMATVLGALSP